MSKPLSSEWVAFLPDKLSPGIYQIQLDSSNFLLVNQIIATSTLTEWKGWIEGLGLHLTPRGQT